jgi:hypothetical protein
MLLEVPLAMMAWVSVVLIQALVHFGMFGARRDPNHAPLGGGAAAGGGGGGGGGVAGLESSDTYQLDDDDVDDDDEGPPEGLETLLSQTGDDVISVRINESSAGDALIDVLSLLSPWPIASCYGTIWNVSHV